MGAEFEDGNPKTQRSMLECEEDHKNREASKWEQHVSEWDQNNEDVCGVCTSLRDQNYENTHDVNEAHDQNNKMVYKLVDIVEERTISKRPK